MYKDLVVPVTGTPGDGDAIAAALALARAFDAHLGVLEMLNLPLPTPSAWATGPDPAMTGLHEELREHARQAAGRRRAALAGEGLPVDVRVVEALVTDPPRAAAEAVRRYDLAVLAGGMGDSVEGAVAHDYFGELLLRSGRPVLVVPVGHAMQVPPRRVLVAWKATRESTRALHDAMPLLLRAARVDVVVVDPAPVEVGGDVIPGADIAVHLARHGVHANVVALASGDRSVADVLLEHAREMPADLVVAGGYGHSRLREWVVGGATRDLLIAAPVPVLFSH